MFVSQSLMEWNNGIKLLVFLDSGFLSNTKDNVFQFDSDSLTRFFVCVVLHIFEHRYNVHLHCAFFKEVDW